MADFDENRVTDETVAAAVSHTAASETVDKLTSTLTNVNIQDGKETPVKKTFQQQVKPVAKPATPKNNFSSKKANKYGYDEDDDYGDYDDYDDYDYDN
jgi:hypothetical protein